MEQHVAEKKEALNEDLLAQARARVIQGNISPSPFLRLIREEEARAKDKARRKKDPAVEFRARQVKAAVRARRDHGL